jgi:ABC-type branched-subunit amino acid transport system substrate-binding protein
MKNYILCAGQMTKIAAFFCFLLSTLVASQERSALRSTAEVETQFKQSVELFNAGRYEDALGVCDGLLQGEAKHQRVAAALYLRARSAYQLGRYETARAALEDLERGFPKSQYLQHGQALLGMIAFQKEEYLEAAVEFLLVVETGRNATLRTQAMEWLRVVLDDYLPLNDLRRLRKSYAGTKGTPYVVLALARDEIAAGNRETGEKLIDDFLRANPDSPLRAELEELRKTGGEPVGRAVRVGVVLPLSGIDADAGLGVYNGIKFAQLTSATHNGGPAIELVVRDSESSLLKTVKVTQQLLEDPSVLAIIGEVDNAATAAAAALANAKGVPFLAPVATENGIGALGENVFQLNADRERKSRALAEYAFRFLNARTFVTIAPQDDYGQQMTDAFSAAIDSLGGEIFAQKWYYGEPQDLGRSFKAIRAAAFRRAYKDSVRLKLFPPGTSSKIMDAEEANIPVTNLNAIFMPLHQEDIRLVAGQRAYFNLQSAIIGGEYWYLPDLEKNRELQRYVDGAIFASDYFIDPENARYKQFRNDFRTRMGTTPEKWELFGYDAATLLFKTIQQGSRKRSQLREALAKIDNFIGIKGEISLNNPAQVNSKVNILQIRGAQIVKLR